MDFLENLKRYAKIRTISIAFPSSIFDTVPTPLLEAYLVGQIARAAVVFNVCEIVIFDEADDRQTNRGERLVKLFEYAECPQYLRKRIFSIEPDLKHAGIIHPLEAQHHLRTSQIECPYREGVTVNNIQIEKKGKLTDYTEVNIGLNQTVVAPGEHKLGMRVTVHVDPNELKKMQAMLAAASTNKSEALIVPPIEPVEKLNLFWGYYVRRAKSLSAAISDNVFCPEQKKFYDLIIGTSERGDCIDDITLKKSNKSSENHEPSAKKHKNEFNHILVVFGGVRGLEHSASCDESLKNSCTDVSKLFDYYINTCPKQGSTTIRTEEAILITLSALRSKLKL